MITLDELCREIAGLRAEALRRWIDNDWVRPQQEHGAYAFEEIDIARVRLIVTLHEELHVDQEAVPIVLSLLDQLNDQRHNLRRLSTAISEVVPAETRRRLRDHLLESVVDSD